MSTEGESPLVADPYVLGFNLNGGLPVNPDTLAPASSGCAARWNSQC